MHIDLSRQGRSTAIFRSRGKSVWLLLCALLCAFLLGGGARSDILSLLILRPLSAIFLVLAIVWQWRNQWQQHRTLLTGLLIVGAVVALHLVPLPPVIWTALPGRDAIAANFEALGSPLPWLPLTITPSDGWNALFSLMLPFACVLLALSLSPRDMRLVIAVLLAIGLISALLGFFQVIGPRQGPLYLYRITNNGSAVGLFANRNHQAIFLAALLPTLATYLSVFEGRSEQVRLNVRLGVAFAILLLPMLLVTGSRTGLATAVVAIGCAWWIYHPLPVLDRRDQLRRMRPGQVVGGLIGVVALAVLTIGSTRAESLNRLIENDAATDLRVQALPAIMGAAWQHFPVGSGAGSFVAAYQMVEPRHLLNPNYLNHAHNDYAELLLTFGLPGMLAIIGAVAFLVWGIWRFRKAPSPLHVSEQARWAVARFGLSILLLMVVASAADYPLRTPALSALAAICLACVAQGWRSGAASATSLPHG